MTGFEPRSSGLESKRSTNWATNTPQLVNMLVSQLLIYHESFLKYFMEANANFGSVGRSVASKTNGPQFKA